MAISTMQQPRQNYGLGSFVKKITKKVTKPITKVASKIVPKEIAGIMRVAAPFLPPGYREAAYLLGTAKQTGRISPVDLALTLAPTVGKMKIGQSGQTISQRLGAMNLPFTDKNLREVLVGSPRDINFMEREGPTRQFFSDMDGPGVMAGKPLGGQNIVDEATQGIFGTGGKMFNFGKGKGLGSFRDDTKIGQLLLGGTDKEGKPTGRFSLSKIAGLGATALSLIQSAKTPEEAGENLAAATGNPYDRQRGEELFGMLDSDIFKIDDRFVLPAKDGGLMRTNYAMGSEDPKPLPNDPTEPVNPFKPKPIGPVLPDRMADIPRDLNLEEAKEMFIKFTGREPLSMQELLQFFNVKEQAAEGGLMRQNYETAGAVMSEEDMEEIAKSPLYKGFKILYGIDPQEAKQNKAYEGKFDLFKKMYDKKFQKGGLIRENYALGSMPTAQESGLGGLPIEADMRYTGGFMPYGAKEKADDVPARLSKNEFVFTADAVRAAGGGSVQKGAQRMYNTMKQLESQPEAKGMA